MLPPHSLARLQYQEARGLSVVMDLCHGPHLDSILLDLKGHLRRCSMLLTSSSKDVLAVAALVVGESERPSLHGFF